MVSSPMRKGQLESRRVLITGAAGGQGGHSSKLRRRGGVARPLGPSKSGTRVVIEEIRSAGGLATSSPPTSGRKSKSRSQYRKPATSSAGLTFYTTTQASTGRRATRRLDRLDLEVFSEVLAINTTGVFLFAKHAIPHLLESADGVLLNVSSVAAYAATPSAMHTRRARARCSRSQDPSRSATAPQVCAPTSYAQASSPLRWLAGCLTTRRLPKAS